MKYHVGLDFGTYQSKACIYHLDNNLHEFFRFPDTDSFFLPSKIGLKSNNTFEYGNPDSIQYEKEYYYFKIASAEDEEFHFETFENGGTKSKLYPEEEFYPFTPEFLSVIYLTYILFTIKDHYRKQIPKKAQGKGFFNKLFTNSKTEEVEFTIKMGIPTEWSQIKNLRRKVKFETILMIAELLQKEYKNVNEFTNDKAEALLIKIKKIYASLTISNSQEFNNELNKIGISICPETAAGLTFIIKTKQLQPGYYGIMDIGGGTTDISFFYVEHKTSIKYLASESYIIAANTVYKLIKKEGDSIVNIHQAEADILFQIKSGSLNDNKVFIDALIKVKKDLNKMVLKLFHRRVYHFKKGMVQHYANQPMLIYGGGSRLPELDNGLIEIYNNGNISSITIPTYFMEKQKIEKYSSILNVLPEDGSWKADLPVLVVALGLSYIISDDFNAWFGDDEYQSKDGSPFRKAMFVQHPYNEDYYIYDVLASKWK